MDRGFGRYDTVMDCARELAIEDQKINDFVRRDLLKSFAIHLESARRPKNSGPHQVVVGSAHGFDGWKKKVILRIEDPRRAVSAFNQASEPAEMPAFVMRHGRVERPEELMTRGGDVGEEIPLRRKTSCSRT